MEIKNIIDEDFTNYHKCSMLVGFPRCTFKCEKECQVKGMCQNSALAKAKSIDISAYKIVERYLANPLSSALVCGGLEPFDTFEDLLTLVQFFRMETDDDIVIYTGYYADEITEQIRKLKKYKNIVIKFGRFIPNQESRYDDVLGVNLASKNQYATRIS